MGPAGREQILQAAVEVFAERGYRGTSIGAVADRAGVTRQDVLRHYRSKKRLLTALLDFRDELNRRQGGGDGEYARMPARFAQAVAFDQRHPSLARAHSVMIAEAAIGLEPARGYARERRRALQDLLTRSLTEMGGERLPSGLTAEAAATALLAVVEGVHQQWLVDQDGGPYPGVVRDVLSVLLGTGPDASRPDSD
ncbi:TetR/AcrR family transcriptional regulator [Streptomyces sp. NPDC002088]|uniref:TetR/AcrR family transcriptional regulator n=1 Tax=unclassified Streptomyces TaxID=2593676 RepID=UPI0033181E4F